jgi:dihydropyrimidinase
VAPFDLVLSNVTLPGETRATIGISGEVIAAVVSPDASLESVHRIDADGRPVLPGVIDPHVHYRYPGYNYRDAALEYDTETCSALVGGVTTALRMHRDVTPFRENLSSEIELLERDSRIDIGFHLTLMTETHLEEFPLIAKAYGVTSFKLYLGYRGAAGALQGIIGSDDGYIFAAMRRIAALGGIACVHAENSEVGHRLGENFRREGRNDLQAWSESRPPWSEGEAIIRAGYLAYNAGCPLYVVHVSSEEGVEALDLLKRKGIEVYGEASVQYLTTTYESELGQLAKVNPPLRSRGDIEALWSGIRTGLIHTIGTDHVAHTAAKAQPAIWDVQPGFAGSATLLPAVITHGLARGLTLEDIAAVTSGHAAQLFGLGRKGRITPGADADLVVVNLNDQKRMGADDLRSSADYSIYQDESLRGWPWLVVTRGAIAFKGGQVLRAPGAGRYLPRSGPGAVS